MAVHALDDHPQPLATLITTPTLLRSLAYQAQRVSHRLAARACRRCHRPRRFYWRIEASDDRCHGCLMIWRWAIGRIWMIPLEVVHSTV